jgi:hypothetical protein
MDGVYTSGIFELMLPPSIVRKLDINALDFKYINQIWVTAFGWLQIGEKFLCLKVMEASHQQ